MSLIKKKIPYGTIHHSSEFFKNIFEHYFQNNKKTKEFISKNCENDSSTSEDCSLKILYEIYNEQIKIIKN